MFGRPTGAEGDDTEPLLEVDHEVADKPKPPQLLQQVDPDPVLACRIPPFAPQSSHVNGDLLSKEV